MTALACTTRMPGERGNRTPSFGGPLERPSRSGPRACLLTESYPPELLGGTEIHAQQLAEHLLIRGVPVQVVTRRIHACSPARELVGNLTVERIGPTGLLKGQGWQALGPLLSFLGSAATWLILNHRRYDVVLALGSKVLPIPALAAGLQPTKRVVFKPEMPSEFWEVISQESLARMRLPAAAQLLGGLSAVRQVLLKAGDRFVAISSEIRDGLLKLKVPADRIVTIPNGIDMTRFHPVSEANRRQLRMQLQLPLDRKLLIYVGRLSRAKGVLMMLEVWRELVSKWPSMHLVMLGKGDGSHDNCEAEVRAFIARHGPALNISWRGAVDDVPAYLQAADAYVSPSTYEGCSLALIEAMASGLPAISTKVGIADEVVTEGRTGRLVHPDSPDQFRQALEWLFDHPGRWAPMGAAARAAVVGSYSIEAVADRYVALLRSLQLPSVNTAAEPVDADGPTASGATRPTASRGDRRSKRS
jgi:glycosyltransferase involved in cell wall biosynthesis